MIERAVLQKYLYRYIGKKIIIPLILLLLYPFLIWMIFFDENRIESANALKSYGIILIGTGPVISLWIERFRAIFKIFLDITSNYQVEKIFVTVMVDSTKWDDWDYFKGEKHRYHMYTVCNENGKKFKIIKDEKVCNTRLVKGNVHTIYVLKHSKYLLDAQVGKIKTGDGSLSQSKRPKPHQ